MKVFLKAVLAGILIGMGGTVYLACPDKLVGSVLFSFGLLTILFREYSLYTGKIGYIRTRPPIHLILAGNLIGALAMGVAAKTIVAFDTTVKLSRDPLQTFLLAIICGALMYLAVDGFKKSKLITIMAVVIFITIGAEHSIANMYYFTVAGWTLKALAYTGIAIVGNAIGAIALAEADRFTKS